MVHTCHLGGVEITQIEAGEAAAVIEHVTHIGHIGSVEITHINACETFAVPEHPRHVGDFGCVESGDIRDIGQVRHFIEPPTTCGRSVVGESRGEISCLHLVCNAPPRGVEIRFNLVGCEFP